MMMQDQVIVFRGRVISKGRATGVALVTRKPISFYGGVDPRTGVIIDEEHDLKGVCIAGKILVFPHGKGSTVGSYILYRLMKAGLAPKAIINLKTDPVVALGAIISRIPLIDLVDAKIFDIVKNGDLVEVDGYDGIVRCYKEGGGYG